ncbi:type I-C CRISPR-associated protein Cas8c/Csd1 [Hahella aquimaris]|uniref:type I-C CRISPR-associated protein Cas8c/Csd1 n=1 Tax=Hahella sp. HNIBRBA332 TaxID=3015983 RepID=UPI00273B17F0|nr:type I-C CRISPR-associated protein Cas8c/Csd1 [Hahella sp. HNIBRBA332]WLQ16770.1 type I-C CRISPR-associated protein Cas8c/Csd1 [Hahella sp. HNIBRBA332]
MILSALNEYYQRLAERDEVPQYGFSREKISYVIVLNEEGDIKDVADIRRTSGKKATPEYIDVPLPPKRAANIEPCFLWDKSSYVLGVSAKKSERTTKEHDAFKELHRRLLAGSDDIGLKAVLNFLKSWSSDQFLPPYFKEEMLDANFVFQVDGVRQYVHESLGAHSIWVHAYNTSGGTEGHCQVTGEYGLLARLHPAIKGVNGAQSSGASIASFNGDAYLSYCGTLQKLKSNKTENDTGVNARISISAAFSYTTVLNHLLRRDEKNRQRLQIGDASVVFWALSENACAAVAAENAFALLLSPPSDDSQETAKLQSILEKIAQGRPLSDVNPELDESTRFYVLGLAPNASRLSIRFWHTGTLGVFARRMAEHYQDLDIHPRPWKTEPAMWRLLKALAVLGKTENIPSKLAGEMTRAILNGSRYPRSLLTSALMRMRADGDVSGLRVALCKAVISREYRLNANRSQTEEVPVSLDTENSNPGYRLGRLFAVLEKIQRSALGEKLNATIRDRYFGAASSAPGSIFPLLLRNAQHHLSKIRKEKVGLAKALERDVSEIIEGLGSSFPRSLRLDDQGCFAIGYYHQSYSRLNQKESSETEASHDEGERA